MRVQMSLEQADARRPLIMMSMRWTWKPVGKDASRSLNFSRCPNPYYFPDDKTFIFWGEFPRAYPAIPNSDRNTTVMDKIRKDLQAKYQKNAIYVMQSNEKELKPYLVMPDYQKKFKSYVAVSESSRRPSLSTDGSVLIFESIGYKPDGSVEGWQFYQYSSDGNHRQITHCHAQIWDVAVAPNGMLLAVIHNIASSRNINNIVIYQVKDGTSKEITLPEQPSRMINNQ